MGLVSRMKRESGRNRRIFRRWLVSYLFMLVIPIVFSSLVYLRAVDGITAEVNRAHSLSLNQLRRVIDGQLDEVQRTCSAIMLSSRLRDLVYHNSQNPADLRSQIIRVQDELLNRMVANTLIKGVYVYLPKNRLFFSDSYKYDEQETADWCASVLGMPVSEMETIAATHVQKEYRLPRAADGTAVEDGIVLLQSLYDTGYKTPVGLMAITLDVAEVRGLLKGLRWTETEQVLLMNRAGGWLSADEAGVLPEMSAYREGLSSVELIDSRDGYAVMQASSGAADLMYLSRLPISTFLERVRGIQTVMIGFLALCLVVGPLAAVLLTRRNYGPLRRLSDLIRSRKPLPSETGSDEFERIETAFQQILTENDSHSERLRQQRTAVRNHSLGRLVKGPMLEPVRMRGLLEEQGLQFSDEGFLVSVLTFDTLDLKTFADDDGDEGKAMTLVSLIVRNVVEEMAVACGPCCVFEVDGLLVCIINVASVRTDSTDNAECAIGGCASVMEHAADMLGREFGIGLLTSMGDLHEGLTGIRTGYGEALEILEYRRMIAIADRFVQYSAVGFDRPISLEAFSLDKEARFVSCIRRRAFEEAKTIMNEIVSDILRQQSTIAAMRYRVFGFFHTVLGALAEAKADFPPSFQAALDPVNRLMDLCSVNQLKEQASHIFDRMAAYVAETADVPDGDEEPEWMPQILSLVEKRYDAPELSIAMAAEAIGISPSHLSRTFKKLRGIGLLEHIHQVRLDQAKKLLSVGIGLNEVARRVGFLEPRTLIRSFKRHEGMTPGEYRRQTEAAASE